MLPKDHKNQKKGHASKQPNHPVNASNNRMAKDSGRAPTAVPTCPQPQASNLAIQSSDTVPQNRCTVQGSIERGKQGDTVTAPSSSSSSPPPPPSSNGPHGQNNAIPSTVQTNLNTKVTTFYPTAFPVHVIDSTAGTVIHVSQLVPHGRIDTISDVCFDVFLNRVTEQLGFDVKGTIRAHVPKASASASMKNEFLMRLDREEQWRGVLQLWQNIKQETCEFVVEMGADA